MLFHAKLAAMPLRSILSISMTLLVALTGLVATAHAANAPAPLRLSGDDFPTLEMPPLRQLVVYTGAGGDFPENCKQLRIARPDEFAARWRPYILHPVLDQCRIEAVGADEAPEVFYAASARFPPGVVSLHGLPAIAAREQASAMYGSNSLVLDVPLARALAVLRPIVERQCRPVARNNPSIVTNCKMEDDGQGGWVIAVGELNSAISLSPDPDNAARTLYTVSGGD